MKQKLHIGIVEDEILIADSIAMHLEDMGHHISGIFQDLDEVIAETKTPDLFFIDIRLSGEHSGLEIARELKALNKKTLFIFLTSNSDKETMSKVTECNPVTCVRKPFSQKDLFAAVELAKAKINLIQA